MGGESGVGIPLLDGHQASSPLMAPIHDRMPALLRPEEMTEYMAGGSRWDFQPFTGNLVVTPCESPLAADSYWGHGGKFDTATGARI